MTVELKVEQGLVAMGHQYHAYRGPLLVSDDFTEAEAVDYLRNHGEAKLYTQPRTTVRELPAGMDQS